MAPLRGRPPGDNAGRLARASALALLAVTVLWVFLLDGSAKAQGSDDHPYFADEFHATEGQGSARIEIVRDFTAAAVTVSYATKPSDAKAGSDFLPARGDLFFPAGDRGPKTFDVAIVDDGEPEDDESLLLILYDSTGKGIDFSELVIQSDEAIPPDPDEGPGSGPGAGSGAGPGAAVGGTGPSGNRPGGRGPEAATPPGSQPLAPGDIATILLGAKPASESEIQAGASATPEPAASEPLGPGVPATLLSALAALGVLAGAGALMWLRARRKEASAP